MEFPCSQLYIILAISGATLGIYASNAKEFKIHEAIYIPLVFVFISWFHVIIAFISKNKFSEVNLYELFFHFIALLLFMISIAILAFLSKRSHYGTTFSDPTIN